MTVNSRLRPPKTAARCFNLLCRSNRGSVLPQRLFRHRCARESLILEGSPLPAGPARLGVRKAADRDVTPTFKKSAVVTWPPSCCGSDNCSQNLVCRLELLHPSTPIGLSYVDVVFGINGQRVGVGEFAELMARTTKAG